MRVYEFWVRYFRKNAIYRNQPFFLCVYSIFGCTDQMFDETNDYYMMHYKGLLHFFFSLAVLAIAVRCEQIVRRICQCICIYIYIL